MPTLTGSKIHHRAKELAPIREKAKAIFLQNPKINYAELAAQTGALPGTTSTWLAKWRKKLPVPPAKPAKPLPELSWEAILKAVPNTAILGGLLIDGFMARLQERDEKIKALEEQVARIVPLEKRLYDMTEDRKKVFQSYNDLLVKMRTGGHFTIDKVQEILIPKE